MKCRGRILTYELHQLLTLSDSLSFVFKMVDHASKIVVESDDPENLTSNWEFALLDLAGSHYAAICVEKDKSTGGEATIPMRLTAWKTIPFIEDERVTRTDAVQAIGGLIKQS
ncbi:hypothetical protein ACOSQ3_014305 [Xanthoceras sorbifolium]